MAWQTYRRPPRPLFNNQELFFRLLWVGASVSPAHLSNLACSSLGFKTVRHWYYKCLSLRLLTWMSSERWQITKVNSVKFSYIYIYIYFFKRLIIWLLIDKYAISAQCMNTQCSSVDHRNLTVPCSQFVSAASKWQKWPKYISCDSQQMRQLGNDHVNREPWNSPFRTELLLWFTNSLILCLMKTTSHMSLYNIFKNSVGPPWMWQE